MCSSMPTRTDIWTGATEQCANSLLNISTWNGTIWNGVCPSVLLFKLLRMKFGQGCSWQPPLNGIDQNRCDSCRITGLHDKSKLSNCGKWTAPKVLIMISQIIYLRTRVILGGKGRIDRLIYTNLLIADTWTPTLADTWTNKSQSRQKVDGRTRRSFKWEMGG